MKHAKALMIAYFLCAGVTWVVGTEGEGILGRLALPDLVMLLLIVVVALAMLRGQIVLAAPRLTLPAVALLWVFGLGMFTTHALYQSLIEWLIRTYLLLGFVVLYTLLQSMSLEDRLDMLRWWVIAATVLAGIGLYDLMTPLVGLRPFVSVLGMEVSQAGVVGTFRNTGQAGSFFCVALVAAIPLQRVSTGRQRLVLLLAILVLTLGVVLSIKRAALIALVLGIALVVFQDLSRGRVKTLLLACLSLLIVLLLTEWVIYSSPAFEWRIGAKLGHSGMESFESFMRQNVDSSVRAFEDSPLLGAGLGGIQGIYQKHEIHSSYFGMLGQAGLLGILVYAWFLFEFFHGSVTCRNSDPRTRRMGRLILPLLIALAVSWIYIVHLRKREFWVTAALLASVMAPASPALMMPRARAMAAGPRSLVPEPHR